MTKKELITSILVELGYRPRTDEEGDVAVRYQMKTVYFLTGDEDEKYMVALLPQFAGIEEGEETLTLVTCNKLSREIKLAKVYVDRTLRNVSACCEFFYTDVESLKENIIHALNILGVVRSAYHNAGRELAE
ncbi:MAG: hypothetical protein NC344_02155 [Bacteroidales bacterium]|nr:hypothetical protein [Bacteroidales bacterium]MCM1146635.1 hypothetical protein [Bacteroidales bacterium]MCM1206027.1 hypothetical protein [Bacillota bacterium]MCM1511072.1 hypothetical protein [Clostridium sp.]